VSTGDLPPPVACAGFTTRYAGSLSGNGASQYQPSSTGYQAAGGTQRGCLAGPSGSDFDLYLYKKSGANWLRVASSTGDTSDELISYTGTRGTYRWMIRSYRGSGTYTFRLQPAPV
jgi:streptogrisin C